MSERSNTEKIENPQNKLICPSCGEDKTIEEYEKGRIVCKHCGRILNIGITDNGPEWRSYDRDEEEEISRTGPPVSYGLHDKGLTTEIDWGNKDSKGKELHSKEKSKAYKLRKWQKRGKITGENDRNLAFGLSEINKLSSHLGLPTPTRELAYRLYRKVRDKNLTRGRQTELVVSAVVYAACRLSEVPRSLDEMSEASGISKKKIARIYRVISRSLNLRTPVVDPVRYVAKIGGKLDVSGETQAEAIKIIRAAQNEGLTPGKSLVGISAGAIYLASLLCDEKKSQREISKVAGVTQVTVRKRYKELMDRLNIELRK